MNIRNEKMSCRQTGRLFFYSFFSLTVLRLPQMLAQTSGMDGFFALVIGSVLGYLFLQTVLTLMERMKETYDDLLRRCLGRYATWLVLLLYLLTGISCASYGLWLLTHTARIYLIRDTPVWLIMGTLTVLMIYGLGSGVECRGRRYELLFWFVVLPLLVMTVLAAWNIEPDHWLPVAQISGSRLLQDSYQVFGCTMAAACMPIYADTIHAHEQLRPAVTRSYVCSVILQLVIFLVLTGIYGVPTVAVMDDPVLEMTAMVKLPGGFLERQDALLCGIWFVGMYAFVENALYVAVWSMEKMKSMQMHNTERIICGILMYAAAWVWYRYRDWNDGLRRIYLAAGVPLLVLTVISVALISAIRNKNKKKGSTNKK